MIVATVGCPLLLGSVWALVPSTIVVAAFLARTVNEERLLQAELPGYAVYAERVRYRLLPGVW
jgi:protein-S-isoprenylcysteine O-methyltransferase Ste14